MLNIDKNKQVLCDFEGREYYRDKEEKSIFAYFYNIYPLPTKMHVSECLSHFNSRRCDERMVIQENMLLHSLISYIHVAAL